MHLREWRFDTEFSLTTTKKIWNLHKAHPPLQLLRRWNTIRPPTFYFVWNTKRNLGFILQFSHFARKKILFKIHCLPAVPQMLHAALLDKVGAMWVLDLLHKGSYCGNDTLDKTLLDVESSSALLPTLSQIPPPSLFLPFPWNFLPPPLSPLPSPFLYPGATIMRMMLLLC